MRGLSLVAASGGHSSSRCAGLSLSRPLLLRSTGCRRAGSVIVAHGPSYPRHVGSSQTRARTRVPCIGRQTLNHCATREALHFPFLHKVSKIRHVFYIYSTAQFRLATLQVLHSSLYLEAVSRGYDISTDYSSSLLT